MTIAAQPVDYEEASRFGILDARKDLKITDFVEKPEEPPSNLASMGIYVFKTDILLEVLEKYCSREDSDFGHHIIPPMIENNEVYVFKYNGYWRDVGTLDSYWQTNQELIQPVPDLNLYDSYWKFYTRGEEQPPVKFRTDGHAEQSLVANGSIINGRVENSVISPGVHIKKGAVVKDSIIFNDSVIAEKAIVDKTIIDKEVQVKANCEIGTGDDYTPNQEKPDLLYNGLNLIAKRATIPAGTTIKRNCRIFSYAEVDDFASQHVASGTTVTSEIGKMITSGDEDQVRRVNI